VSTTRRLALGIPVLAGIAIAACGDGLGPRREITLTFCSPMAAVAVQNPSGAWVHVGSGTRVTFPALPRIAMAIAYPVSNAVSFYYASADEVVKTFSCPQDAGPSTNKTVNVSLRGIGANEFAMIATPGNTHMHVPADFPLCCLPPQPVDVVAWKQYEPAGRLPTVPRIIIRRGLNPENNSTLPVFDFASAEAFAPVTRTLTLAAAPAGTPIYSQTDFFTASGVTMMVSADSTSSTSLAHHAVPADKMAADDMHVVRFGADFRDVIVFFHAAADRTVPFGPAMTPPILTTVNERLHVDVPRQPEYDKQLSLSAYADAGSTIQIIASSEYLDDGAGHWSFTFPDLSHIPEFGTTTSNFVGGFMYGAYVSSMPLTFRTPDAKDGDVFRIAHLFGQR